MGMLHSLGLHAQELRPGGLLALIDELTSPTTAHETDIHAWNHHDTLDVQAIRRDIELEVGDDRLILRTERFRETGRDEEGNPEVGECYPDHFDVRHYAVRSTPERWAPWECARSEEHTSELQSLMRISYAVFCLKKKNKQHKENWI